MSSISPFHDSDSLVLIEAGVLEELFLDDIGNRKPQLAFLDADADEASDPRLESLSSTSHGRGQNTARESSTVDEQSPSDVSSQPYAPRKRRRVDGLEQRSDSAGDYCVPPLPALPLLEAIVEAHFHSLHHWMPILHETRFRVKLKDSQERARLVVLFHALVSTSIKYIRLEDFDMTLEDAARQIRISRTAVMLNAMESLSLENTQALVFLAFDYVLMRTPASHLPFMF